MGINNTLTSALMALIGTVYAGLFIDFAQRHSLLLVVLLSTLSLHLFYISWGLVAGSPAPLGMGFLVLAGYGASAVGVLHALIRQVWVGRELSSAEVPPPTESRNQWS